MRRLAESHQSTMLLCEVRGYSFAIDRSHLRAIERADRVAWVEGESPILGRFASGGTEIPVFSIPGLAGEAEQGVAFETGRVLLCRGSEGGFGLHVDQVQPLTTASSPVFLPMPLGLGGGLFTTLLKSGDDVVPIIDLTALGAEPVERTMPTGSTPPLAKRSASTRLLLIPMAGESSPERPFFAGLLESQVVEVLEGGACRSVLGSPPGVHGVRPWQGTAVAVHDLFDCLGVERPTNPGPVTTLIVRPPMLEEPFGLRISGRWRSLKLPIPHLASTRADFGEATRFDSVIETDFATIGLLDIANLVQAISN